MATSWNPMTSELHVTDQNKLHLLLCKWKQNDQMQTGTKTKLVFLCKNWFRPPPSADGMEADGEFNIAFLSEKANAKVISCYLVKMFNCLCVDLTFINLMIYISFLSRDWNSFFFLLLLFSRPQDQAVDELRPLQEPHHNVSVVAAVDHESAKLPPQPGVAPMGLPLAGGEPIVPVPGQWCFAVSDDDGHKYP